jgi:hypothetical protein
MSKNPVSYKVGQRAVLPTQGAIPENTLYLAWSKPALRHPRMVYVRDFLLRKGEPGV